MQGYGVFDKLVLQFEQPFWDLDADFIFSAPLDLGGRWATWCVVCGTAAGFASYVNLR